MLSHTDSRLAFREYLTTSFAIAVTLALSILLHLKWCGTPLREPESRWQEIFEYHRTFYPFSVRPLTTYPLLFLHQLTGLSLKLLFFLEQYLLASVLGVTFFRYLWKLGFMAKWARIGVCLLMLSFPILFAHSEPIFTWDDFWVYLFLVLCCMSLLDRRAMLAGLWFGAACFAREQTLVYWPVLLLGLRLLCDNANLKRILVAAFAPVIVIIGYWVFVWQTPDPARFSLLHYNFQSAPFTVNSLFSVFVAFGVLWVVWIAGLVGRATVDSQSLGVRRFLMLGSIYAVAITLPIGLALSYARETRIFFPPFVLVIPIALSWLEDRWTRLQGDGLRRHRALLAAAATALAIAGILMGKYIFPDFDYRRCANFCQAWAGLHIGLIVTVLMTGWISALRGKTALLRTDESA